MVCEEHQVVILIYAVVHQQEKHRWTGTVHGSTPPGPFPERVCARFHNETHSGVRRLSTQAISLSHICISAQPFIPSRCQASVDLAIRSAKKSSSVLLRDRMPPMNRIHVIVPRRSGPLSSMMLSSTSGARLISCSLRFRKIAQTGLKLWRTHLTKMSAERRHASSRYSRFLISAFGFKIFMERRRCSRVERCLLKDIKSFIVMERPQVPNESAR